MMVSVGEFGRRCSELPTEARALTQNEGKRASTVAGFRLRRRLLRQEKQIYL